MEEDSVNCISSEGNISLRPESGSLIHYSAISAVNADSSETRKESASIKRENSTSFKPQKDVRNMRPVEQKENKPRYRSQIKRSHAQSSLDLLDRFKAEEEARRHCSKIFQLKDSSNDSHTKWTLHSSEALYTHDMWMVDELQKKKEDLNKIKSMLECYDIETWHKHTYECNPAQKISYAVRNKANPELLTQAFLKFYEILHALPVFPEESTTLDSEFNSLHLCEAPGGFVVAINHFLSLQKPNVKWRWVANSLNPYYEGTPASECISDDRFILHTLDNWCFGKDDIGNLMSVDYLEELMARMEGRKVHLVTADGSIDCQRNPAEQESMTQCLHFCEVYAAVRSLREGGTLVLKTFTFFECESVNLMYFISCCFSDVHVVKPITSKLGNSEVYIVATGFNPPQSLNSYLDALVEFYGKRMDKKTLFSRDEIPQSFMCQIIHCCEFFKTLQAEAIQRNMHLYDNRSEWNEQYCSLLKSIVLRIYFEKTDCKAIDPSRNLVAHKLQWDKHVTPKSNDTRWGELINKRPKHIRIQFLNDQLEKFSKDFAFSIRDCRNYVTYDVFVDNSVLETMSFGRGKPMHFVYTSRFCHSNLMHACINYFMECATEDEMDLVKHSHRTDIAICSEESYIQFMSQDAEDTRTEILKTYPKVVILDEGNYPAPHACRVAFNQLFDLIKDGKLYPGTSVAIMHCPLFTRLQNGLLCIFSSVFEKCVFWQPVNVSERAPFFVLNNFTSVEKGKCLSSAMVELGWLDSTREQINRVLPMRSLIQGKMHATVCRYNALFCLRTLNLLKHYQRVASNLEH